MNKLASMYNLDPGTAASLSQIAGQNAPPPGAAGNPLDLDENPDDPSTWQGVRAIPEGGTYASAANPARDPNWSPELEAKKTEQASLDKALDKATPQGPAPAQDFPTVRAISQEQGGGTMPGQGAGMAMRAIPAHWSPGTHSVGMQRGMDPGELEEGRHDRDVGSGLGLMAGDKRLEAAQRSAQADALYAAAHTKASQDMRERMQALQVQREQYVAGETAKLEKLAVAAQKEVDPKAYWNDKGSFGKVLAAVAIGLGQFGASMRGGPNGAWQIIKEGMDKNIDAQKSNIANAGHAYNIRSNLYARNLQEFGDKERAVLATKINYLDQVAAMVDGQKAIAKSKDAEAAALDLQKRIYDERAQAADQFAKLTHTQVSEQANEHFVPTQYVGGAGAGQKGKEGLYVPTLGGYARDEKTAQTLNNKGSLRMQIGENMRKIHSLLEEAKSLSSVTSPIRLREIDAEVKQLTADSLTKNTVLEGQGAMSAGDKAVAEEAKGLQNLSVQLVPNSLIARKQERLKKAAEGVLEQHRLEGEANGIQVGKEVYVDGPQGKTPVRVLEGRNKAVTKNTEGYDDLVTGPKGVPQKR